MTKPRKIQLRPPPTGEFPLGERLAAARALAGVSAKEVDALAGVGLNLGRVERGVRRHIGLDSAVAYALTLGLSLDWLALGKGPAPSATVVQQAVATARQNRAPR